MTALFNRIFTWANFWALARGLAVCLVIYMAWGFLYPLAVRAGGTGKYIVTELPGNAGNWIADKVGLKGGTVAKTTTPPPAAPADMATYNPIDRPPSLQFGGPNNTSTTTAAQAHERRRLAEEEQLAYERLSALATKQGEWESIDKEILLGTPNESREVKVTVFDASKDADGDGKPDQVAVPHTVIIVQEGENQLIPLNGNSSAYPKVGYGPVRFEVMARIDGKDGLSPAKPVSFSNKETGSKDIQLLVP